MDEQPGLSFAGLLRQLRAEAQLTQEELAEAASLSPRSISDLERGINRTAHKDTAMLLAGALHLAGPVRELFVAAARGRALAGDVLVARQGMRPGAFAAVAGLPVSLPPRSAMLAGREELLADLDARLTSGLVSGPQVVALYGLGGAGKTSVAVEYAHRHLAEVGLAWQFPAEDREVLLAEFARLAAQLGAREVVDARDPVASVHAVLAASAAGWLLVFDDVGGYEAVQRFLPPAGRGRVLITSQSAAWPPGWAVEVGVLGTKVAAQFLVKRTGDADEGAAEDLAAELGGLPLALEQAAAYIQATGITLAGYVSVFRERRADLLARGEAAGHPAGVAATLGLALSRLGERAAVGLLRLLACLAPEPVPLALLLADAHVFGELAPAVAVTLGPLLGDRVAAGDAVAELRRYSLVTPAGDGSVSVHRLVQAITAGQMPADVAAQWRQAAAALVEAAIPADTSWPQTWPACAALLPHGQAALADESAGQARLANYLGERGSYASALQLEQRIVDARERTLGSEHPHTMAARNSLARWTGKAGDAARARDEYAALLPVRERVLGAEHADTLATRNNLARWTGEAGDAAGACDQFAALLPVCIRVLGPEHNGTLATWNNLARWTGEAGDAAGARDQYRALLPEYERVLGPEHPYTVTARSGLAFWTGQAGDAAGARDQYAALLSIRERDLGAEHPATLAVGSHLARWTGEAGDAARARDQYAALLPVHKRVFGPGHPETLTVRADLAYWTEQAESGAKSGVD